MPPVVERTDEEEQELLMIAADRRRRVARAKLRYRAYLVGLAALVGATTGLAVINVNLAHQTNAAVKLVTAVLPNPPVTIDTAMLDVTPPPPPAIAPKPEPESIVEKSALPPLPKPRAVVKPPVPRAQTPPQPPVTARKAPPFIEAKSDPAIIRSPAATSPPPERPRDVESSQLADSSGRVAHWMAETYGRRDAQRRVELAMTLYPEGDARTEHWRKVLGHLRDTN